MKHLYSKESQVQFAEECALYLKYLNPEIQIQNPGWHPGMIVRDFIHEISFHLFFVSNAAENKLFLQNNSILSGLEKHCNICLWQDQWYSANTILTSRIAALYGKLRTFHGRKTKVALLFKDKSSIFFEKHHLQGNAQSKYQYGLFDAGQDCLALMSFSKGRTIMRGGEQYRSYEIIRFCNLTGIVVAGGMGKLIQHFINQHQPDDIATYVDRDWSVGNSYAKLGFLPSGTLPVQEFWIDKKTGKRLFPEKIKKATGVLFDDEDAELALYNKVASARVFNSGSIKFIRFIK